MIGLRPMRVTQLMISRRFGGAERHFVDLAHALVDRGHQVQAIFDARFTHASRLDAPGVRADPIVVRFRPDPLAGARITRLIREFRPHVVHAHLGRGIRFAARSAGRCGVPLIATLHTHRKRYHQRDIDFFVTLNDPQRKVLLAQGIDARRITTIPNFSTFVPVDEIPPARAGTVRFVTLGRFDTHHKGFDVLLRALKRLRERGRDVDLVIAGDGPDRAKLEAMSRELGIDACVEFPGWVDDVSALLCRGDVFVLSSRYEPFGIVLLEAMAHGLPIVTTRVEGPRQFLDEHTAYLADADDDRSLDDAMAEAAADPTGRRIKAQAALGLYESTYREARVVPRLVELYEQVAAQGPAPPKMTRSNETPANAVCLKSDGGHGVWLLRCPGELSRTLKVWSLGPWTLVKLVLGIAQPQRQVRGTRRLLEAGIPTPRCLGRLRVGLHRRRPVISLELEYAPGRTAWELVAREPGPQGPDDRLLLACARRLGELVARLAAAGIFHRDIKLTNVVVDTAPPEPAVSVIDTVGVRKMRRPGVEVERMLERFAIQPVVVALHLSRSLRLSVVHNALRPLPGSVRREVIERLRRRGFS